VTIFVLFTAIRGCNNEAGPVSTPRADAAEDEIDVASTPIPVRPTTPPVVIQATPIPGSEGPTDVFVYPVESGDLLSDIAIKFNTSVDGYIAETFIVSVDALLEANPGLDPAALQIGQEIEIPPIGTGLDPAALTPEPTRVVPTREPGQALYYTIEGGDSLVGIAADFGVTVNAIMGANDLEDANDIQVGDVLLMPPPTEGN